MEDATFNKLVEQVQGQLTQLHDNIEQFDSDYKDATSSIGPDLSDLQDQITNLLKQLQNNIQRLENNTGHMSSRQQKLKQIKQFYKKEIDKFSQMCKSFEAKLQEQKKSISKQSNQKWNEPKEIKQNPQNDLQEQFLQDKYDIDNQLIRERDEDIQRIDREAQLLNKLVGELAIEAHKADEVLDLVDAHQQNTKDNLVKANVELDQAQESQNSTKKKYIFLAVCAFILVGVLVTILVLKFK